MGTITLRLPEDTHQRIKALAAARKISVNKLFEAFSVIALTEYDAETRFKARTAKGSRKKGLAILDKLDKHFVQAQETSNHAREA